MPQKSCDSSRAPFQTMSYPETYVLRHGSSTCNSGMQRALRRLHSGKLIIFTRACGDYQKPSGLSRGGLSCRSPWVIVVHKLRQPYTIGTRRTMSQPRLSVLTLPRVVADAAETSPSREGKRPGKSKVCHPACRQQSPLLEYSFGRSIPREDC